MISVRYSQALVVVWDLGYRMWESQRGVVIATIEDGGSTRVL